MNKLILVVLCLAAASARAQTVTFVQLSKSAFFVQTQDNFAALDPTISLSDGGPFGFGFDVQGTGLNGIAAPVAAVPAGSQIVNTFPFWNNGKLGFNFAAQQWEMGAPSFNDWGSTTQFDRDQKFANGVYTLTLLGTTLSLDLEAPTTPPGLPVPRFTLTGGAWSWDGKYVIDVNSPLTITSNAFAGYTANPDAAISFGLGGPFGAVVQSTSIHSQNPDAPTSINTTIPANTLQSGVDYRIELDFAAVSDEISGVAGNPDALAVAYYDNGTWATIHVIGNTVGPQGPPGPAGPTGPQGPAGAAVAGSLLFMPEGVSPGDGYRPLGTYTQEAIVPPGGNPRTRMNIVIWQKL